MTERLVSTERKATREGFGDELLVLADSHPSMVCLCADLTDSLRMRAFAKAHPKRFFQVGIAEANMMGLAAGLATAGKIPITGTFANFSTGRVYDQIRQSIAYSNTNVKICASHAGLTLGEDGATHQILEDMALMKALPGMCVINPCDYEQTRQALAAAVTHPGPVYLRFGRPSVPAFTTKDTPFVLGKALRLIEGVDVSIFATGHLVWEALCARDRLSERGVSAEVINIHTIKPLDAQAIVASVTKTLCAVSAEEHQCNGGLGDSIAQTLARHHPVPMEYVAVNDQFGESGKPHELMHKYGLTAERIVSAAYAVLDRKHQKT